MVLSDNINLADNDNNDSDYNEGISDKHRNELKTRTSTYCNDAADFTKNIASAATLKAAYDFSKGNKKSGIISSAIAAGATAGTIVTRVAEIKIHNMIDNIPDNHPIDEPVSPSAFDSDLPVIKKNTISIYDYLLDIIQDFSIEYQLIICIFIFIIIIILLLFVITIKNKVNNNLNKLPLNNKYFELFKVYKN